MAVAREAETAVYIVQAPGGLTAIGHDKSIGLAVEYGQNVVLVSLQLKRTENKAIGGKNSLVDDKVMRTAVCAAAVAREIAPQTLPRTNVATGGAGQAGRGGGKRLAII